MEVDTDSLLNIKTEIKVEEIEEDYEDQPAYIDPTNIFGDIKTEEGIECEIKKPIDHQEIATAHSENSISYHELLAKEVTKSNLKVCEICLKTFKTAKELTLHLRVHTNERPYQCTECDKAFKQKGALRDHSVTHSGEKKHLCAVCLGTFTTSSSLKRHMRKIHSTGKVFTCQLCREEFMNTTFFKDHKEQHVKQILNTTTEEEHRKAKENGCYTCSICQKTFDRYIRFFNHLEFHAEYEFPCPHCDLKFSNLLLQKHIRTLHKDKL